MNKTYRSVWNHALGAWVAVSELTTARGKRSGGVATVLVAAGLSVLATSGAAQQVDYDNGDNLSVPIFTTSSDVTLNSTDAGTATQSGVIDGPNGIIKTGAGTIVLGAGNSYLGTTRINAGALQVSTDANLGAPAAESCSMAARCAWVRTISPALAPSRSARGWNGRRGRHPRQPAERTDHGRRGADAAQYRHQSAG